MSMMRAPTWIVTAFFATIHFLALVALTLYCLKHYYDQVSPLDPIGYVLLFPAFLVLRLAGNQPLFIVLVPLNSILWGYVLARIFGRWFTWPLWHFSLRMLLVAMTLIAVVLGIFAAF
jgi:hypothetical protein